MTERNRNSNPETSMQTSNLQPETYGQRLKSGLLQFARDVRGVMMRMGIYLTAAAGVFTGMMASGFSEENSIITGAVVVVATVLPGEFYFFPKLAKRLPWFRVSIFDDTFSKTSK